MTEEKTYSQMREEFSKRFYGKIVPHIQNFEQERISHLESAVGISAILIFIPVLIIFPILKTVQILPLKLQFCLFLWQFLSI